MSSQALRTWNSAGRVALDEMEAAISAIGGLGRGRRRATSTLNHAYCLTLSSRFQAYCRDLHDESARVILIATPPNVRRVMELNLIHQRKLDQGNPNPGNIAADFNRFGLLFWDEVKRLRARNIRRQQTLEELNSWRNAVAHQKFDPQRFPKQWIRLKKLRRWRNSCERLADDFDSVMFHHLNVTLGLQPW